MALNELLGGSRLSDDVDLFHDTQSALDESWTADRVLLEQRGFAVTALRERPSFVEAQVAKDGQTMLLQWVRDSAFRFFPLLEDPTFGLVLHPFDLATNKVLALVGRLEARDWIATIQCCKVLQPLGYLAWAACGKDPGFNPLSILEHAKRNSHYSTAELASLAFDGPSPDGAALSMQWRTMLSEADQLVKLLPPAEAGKCVVDQRGRLMTASPLDATALAAGAVRFHAGSIRGALPQVVG